MYAVIILKYYLQIRYTGGIMFELEQKFLGGDAETLGLLHVLRQPRTRFYGRGWTFGVVWTYVAIIFFLPTAAVLAVCGYLGAPTGGRLP